MNDAKLDAAVRVLSRTQRDRQLIKGLPTPAEERLLDRDDLRAEDLTAIVEIRSRAIEALFR